MKKVLTIVAAIAITTTLSFAAQEEHKHDGSESGFTLIQVMQDLMASLSRIQFGIMTNNRLMIAEGAKAIAHHPAPKGGLTPYIKKNADMITDTIPEMDRVVHDTAREIFKGAMTASMDHLQEKAGMISGACVGCHDLFRD